MPKIFSYASFLGLLFYDLVLTYAGVVKYTSTARVTEIIMFLQ